MQDSLPNLLEYNSTHRILLCRECRYAIQKSAVSSHLLRHKVYRAGRQHLLDCIAHFEIVEPEDVVLPSPQSPAIDGLPVIPGFKCTLPGCTVLCASTKRMKRHHNEVHGSNGASEFTSYARPVQLQTFFRGTKLRYFQVNAHAPSASRPLLEATDDAGSLQASLPEYEDEIVGKKVSNANLDDENNLPMTPAIAARTVLSNEQNISQLATFDLAVLTDFHHYTMQTSFTLPRPFDQTSFWYHDVVHQALRHHWLTCGLLALASCHAALSSDDPYIALAHHERSLQYASNFTESWPARSRIEETTDQDWHLEVANARVSSLLTCALWILPENEIAARSWTIPRVPFTLHALIEHLATSAPSHSSTQKPPSHNDQDMILEAQRVLKSHTATARQGSSTTTNAQDRHLLHRVADLPPRLTGFLERPLATDAHDVVATLTATAALVVCCGRSLDTAADDAQGTWDAAASWPTMIPELFRRSIHAAAPAALVVVAHWLILVSKAEQCGAWWVKGVGSKGLWEVRRMLAAARSPVLRLVEELVRDGS